MQPPPLVCLYPPGATVGPYCTDYSLASHPWPDFPTSLYSLSSQSDFSNLQSDRLILFLKHPPWFLSTPMSKPARSPFPIWHLFSEPGPPCSNHTEELIPRTCLSLIGRTSLWDTPFPPTEGACAQEEEFSSKAPHQALPQSCAVFWVLGAVETGKKAKFSIRTSLLVFGE